MESFWDSNVWSGLNLVAVLLLSLLAANTLKRKIALLRNSLIPTSVLGGGLLLLLAGLYDLIFGSALFETRFFGGDAYSTLEVITYHTLALGFIASSFKSGREKFTRQRTAEIFNTGVTTVSTYLLQAVVGMGITLLASLLISDFFSPSGILLPFGYGQGTGQAMNYGSIYENEFGFVGGKSFGLAIAALGFISASLGGVVHLNVLKKRGRIIISAPVSDSESAVPAQGSNEVPWQGSMDKMTIQVAFVSAAYLLAYLAMFMLGNLLPGMRSVIYGFNFLLGVLTATLVKIVVRILEKTQLMHRKYLNDFLMTRVSNFCFDIMVVAGIAAIRFGTLEKYWGLLLILGIAGAIVTFIYNRYVAKTLFGDYCEEQFLMMYGMLTGTASTGTILLREIDGNFRTPAADNMVYQNFPAIAFGFPMMLLASTAPVRPILTYIILFLFFVIMNLLLFREKIFRKKAK